MHLSQFLAYATSSMKTVFPYSTTGKGYIPFSTDKEAAGYLRIS